MINDCSADLGRVCSSGKDGEPCESCVAEEAYWRNWGRSQRFTRYSKEEVMDAYSSPSEHSKRDILLSRLS